MCGGNESISIFSFFVGGPSPRVWGKPSDLSCSITSKRTIPTRVGETSLARKAPSYRTDHPHVCVGNIEDRSVPDCDSGPSPRVWGKQTTPHWGTVYIRTIPTRGGETSVMLFLHVYQTDHPHAWGGNINSYVNDRVRYGPSPRVCGKHHGLRYAWRLYRTIPTRVGETLYRVVPSRLPADHPHACGGN